MPRNRVHKLSDGRCGYSVTDRAGDRHRIVSHKGETERDFKIRCDALDKQCQFELRTETFDDLFTAWLEMHVRPNLSNGDEKITVHLYETFVKRRIGHLRLSEISPVKIYQLLSDAAARGWSRSTVSKVKGVVSRPFRWAIGSIGLDMIPPTAAVRFRMQSVKKTKRRRYLADEEVDRLMGYAVRSKYHDAFALMLLIGLRPSEALGLQIGDIEPEHLTVNRAITLHDESTGKTDTAVRRIRLPAEAIYILKRLKQQAAFASKAGWLFPTEDGGDPSMNAMMCAFNRAVQATAKHKRGGRNGMKKLGVIEPPITATIYDLRHTFATRMVGLGMPAVTLQKIMGHADIKTTLTYYTHVTDEMQDKAAELMQAGFATKFATISETKDA